MIEVVLRAGMSRRPVISQGITSAKKFARTQKFLIYDKEFFQGTGITQSETLYDP